MKIKAWIKYTEGYLPTPRHRKLRYRECESFEDVIIDETTTNNCFEPEDKGLAFAKAINTAIKRGDTDSIEYIKKCPVIEIY